jgi:hypothetical protein
LSEGLDQEDGLRDFPNWVAQTPALIAHPPIRFALCQCEPLLQEAFCAFQRFAIFELLSNLAGLFLKPYASIRQMRMFRERA